MNKLAAAAFTLFSLAALSLPASSADCGRSDCGWDSARAYCRKKGERLPTIDELLQAWEAKCTGGKTSDLCSGWYWTSKERDPGRAWGVSFKEGAADSYKKSETADVYCKPVKKAAEKAAPAQAENKGARCAKEPCTWNEAAAYCRSSGVRLYKVKEWNDLCRAECKNGEVSDGCKRWFWLGESENANYAYSGTCDSPADASVHSVEKTDLTYARCTLK